MDKHNITLEGFDAKVYHALKVEKPKTVKEAVEKVSKRLGAEPEEVAKSLYRLNKIGVIDVLDPSPPKTFIQYLTSVHAFWYWAVVATTLATLATIYVLPQRPPFIYLRYVLGTVFVLYIPGFTLVEALYPKDTDLDPLERLALSLGLSLAVVPLIGLVLNYTPWGIRLTPVVSALSTFSITLATVAAYRRFRYFKLGGVAVYGRS